MVEGFLSIFFKWYDIGKVYMSLDYLKVEIYV